MDHRIDALEALAPARVMRAGEIGDDPGETRVGRLGRGDAVDGDDAPAPGAGEQMRRELAAEIASRAGNKDGLDGIL